MRYACRRTSSAGLGAGEVVGERGELVRNVGNDEGPTAAERRPAPGERLDAVGDLAGEPVIQALRRALGARRGKSPQTVPTMPAVAMPPRKP